MLHIEAIWYKDMELEGALVSGISGGKDERLYALHSG